MLTLEVGFEVGRFDAHPLADHDVSDLVADELADGARGFEAEDGGHVGNGKKGNPGRVSFRRGDSAGRGGGIKERTQAIPVTRPMTAGRGCHRTASARGRLET